MPSLPDELMLLALGAGHDTTAGPPGLDHGLGGAALCDLMLGERLAIVDDRVVLRGDGMTGDPALDGVLEQVARCERPRSPGDWVERLAPAIRKDVLAGLQPGPAAVQDVRDRVRAVLVDGAEPDDRAAALIALAQACGLAASLVADRPWEQIEPRVTAMTAGDRVAAAVCEAIERAGAATVEGIAGDS